ncbi:MAG: N-acetyltransferase [Planctomycetes bacterium]|nr:N-acetyltransferase [Planctomycetota bacterium]
MTLPFTIRTAATTDADELLEIYRPYVETTAVSFELEIPTAARFAERIKRAVEKWSWLVAEIDERPIGYAYGSAHRAREAYAYSVETSAYVHASHHRDGVARALYTVLFRHLRELGYGNAYAGITLPNEPSVGFHKSFGFEPIGVFPRVGYKFGKWHDVAWLYRPIREKDTDDDR